MFRIILTSFSLLFSVTQSTEISASTKSQFEQALSNIGADEKVVGLAAAVVRNGKIESINTFGVREFGQPEPIDAQTIFRIASLSKAFAATITGELVNEGQLSLDTPISKFNQDFELRSASQTKAMTLSDILSHRVSLPPYAYDNLLEAGQSPPKILQKMKKVSPICKVGTCYAYQNVAFNAITSAIETASNQSYETNVVERIFKPLGMSGASFGKRNLESSENWARSHNLNRKKSLGNKTQKSLIWDTREVKQAYYNVPAAGGINANISDMAKWLAAQIGYAPEVLPLKRLSMLHEPLVSTPAELRRTKRMKRVTQAHYGLGWRIYKYAGQTVVNHSGSVESYVAQIAFMPEKDVGIVLLSNSRSQAFWDILQLFLDYELGLENDLLLKADIKFNN